MPLPYGPVAAVQQYVRAQPVAVQVIAVAAFASSVPLAVYAAIASARLRQLGVTTPGPTIALAGTSQVTTELVPITELSPTVTPVSTSWIVSAPAPPVI